MPILRPIQKSSACSWQAASKNLRAGAVLAIVLAMVAPLRADDQEWVGKRVIPRSRDFALRIDEEPVERSRKAMVAYIVERIDSPSLWLRAENQPRLIGSAMIDDVIPIDRAIDFFTDRIRANPRDSFAYAMRGLVRQSKREHSESLNDYDQAIRLEPGDAALYCRRGDLRVLMKEADRGISDYNEAMRIDPKSVLALTGRGTAWSMKNDKDRAVEDFSEAIWLDPLCIPAYLSRGAAWQEKGEGRKAIIDCDTVIRLDPENAAAYGLRGRAWMSLKAFGRAAKDLELAIQQQPNDPISSESLAWIRATCPEEQLRDGKKAIALASHACEMSGWKNARCLATLAAAHAEAGDFNSAISWQAKANALSSAPGEKAEGQRRLDQYRRKLPYRATAS